MTQNSIYHIKRIAKVDSTATIIKGDQSKATRRFINKYMHEIINGIQQYYPKRG